jgi:predicted RNase H-like HicB family nuclease
MRKNRTEIKSFNAVDPKSGYAIRFGQARDASWSAITVSAEGMCVLGGGNTLRSCRKSISNGITFALECMREDGDPIPVPERRTISLPN